MEKSRPRLRLNPGRAPLPRGCRALVIGQSEAELKQALSKPYSGLAAALDWLHVLPSSSANGADSSLAALNFPNTPADIPNSNPKGHFILAGAEESFLPFARHLWKACGDPETPICLLHPSRPLCFPDDQDEDLQKSIYWVSGSAADPQALAQAGAASAQALIFLAKDSRPIKTAQSLSGMGGSSSGSTPELVRSTRQAVLADADALLSCYGVAEESEAELTHTIVELLYTTSVE